MVRILRAADLFCGAGGTTQGAHQSGAAKVVCAVNHWKMAVKTHSANFPECLHINSRLDQVNPGECSKIDLLFASPECTHHSRARGGRPTSDQHRSGAWDLMRWIDFHRPSGIVVENVPEFRQWGPVGDNGKPLAKFSGRFFAAWVEAIKSAGYRVDDRLLNAADFGAATSRTRLFIVARKGNRSVRWPEPTHGKRAGGELPGMQMQRWRAAAEVIDWSIPCPSVFLRKHPLRDNTLFRIEAGLRRFVGPFVAELRNNMTARSPGEPLSVITCSGAHHRAPTLTARGGVWLGVPFLSAFHNGKDGANRNYPTGDAVPTLDTQNRFGVAVPFGMMLTHGTTAHRGEVTSHGAGYIAVPFVITYYTNGKAYSVADPLCTISTRDRCGLSYAIIQTAGSIEPRTDGERKLYATMVELGVADVGFRMLANAELSAAQGFPSTYVFHGNKGDVTKQIGNSVAPDVAEALTRTIAEAA